MGKKITMSIIAIVPIVMLITAGIIAYNFFTISRVYAPPSWENGKLDPPKTEIRIDKKGDVDLIWKKDDLAENTIVVMSISHFPENIRDGMIVHFGQETYTWVAKKHFPNDDMHFSIWSVDKEGNLSDVYIKID